MTTTTTTTTTAAAAAPAATAATAAAAAAAATTTTITTTTTTTTTAPLPNLSRHRGLLTCAKHFIETVFLSEEENKELAKNNELAQTDPCDQTVHQIQCETECSHLHKA